MKMRCACGAGSRWLEEAPQSTHAYRVECLKCRTFAKWGAQSELDALIGNEEIGEVVTYEERMAIPPDPFAPLSVD